MAASLYLLYAGLPGFSKPFSAAPLIEGPPVPSWMHDVALLGDPIHSELTALSGERVPVSRLTVPGDCNVFICGRCTSSMDVAWELARLGLLHPWDAVLALEQSAGRGQLRRPWQSPSGNLHASLYLLAPEPEWDRLMSLVMGHVLCAGLESLGANLQIKWPNDLYQNGRKIGGILVEQRGAEALVGIGLNLVHAPADCEMRNDAAASAAVLELEQQDMGVLRHWLALVSCAKSEYMNLLENNSPSGFLSCVSRRLLWMGRTVFHRDGDQWNKVRIVGLHRDGGLILDRGGKEDIVYSGGILLGRP